MTLGELKERTEIRKTEYKNALKGRHRSEQNLTETVRDRLGLPNNINGVFVIGVGEDTRRGGSFKRTT